jgi:glycosyltransferase involved in cell wall biosynthesis
MRFVALLLALFSCALVQAEKKLIVVIPSYNNARWYQKNLGSALGQAYENYHIIYIDDASPDGTGALVESYLAQRGSPENVTLIKNSQRHGSLYNTYHAIWTCAPDDVIVILDGDDWFTHDKVLDRIALAYEDPNVWITYGQFVVYPSGQKGFARQVPLEVLDAGTIRKHDWVTTHVKTFYAGLFQKLRREDLLWNGAFFPMACDLSFMLPMMEMAGRHSCFIPDVLYVYNYETPINEGKVNQQLLNQVTNVIRRQRPYAPIGSL